MNSDELRLSNAFLALFAFGAAACFLLNIVYVLQGNIWDAMVMAAFGLVSALLLADTVKHLQKLRERF